MIHEIDICNLGVRTRKLWIIQCILPDHLDPVDLEVYAPAWFHTLRPCRDIHCAHLRMLPWKRARLHGGAIWRAKICEVETFIWKKKEKKRCQQPNREVDEHDLTCELGWPLKMLVRGHPKKKKGAQSISPKVQKKMYDLRLRTFRGKKLRWITHGNYNQDWTCWTHAATAE